MNRGNQSYLNNAANLTKMKMQLPFSLELIQICCGVSQRTIRWGSCQYGSSWT
jgi:hypothetical protein